MSWWKEGDRTRRALCRGEERAGRPGSTEGPRERRSGGGSPEGETKTEGPLDQEGKGFNNRALFCTKRL